MAPARVVQGNSIGTDVTGNVALANQGPGIFMYAAVQNNLIGGPNPGQGNLISGNTGDGIGMYDPSDYNNKVQGNRIGTNAAGTSAPPGQRYHWCPGVLRPR